MRVGTSDCNCIALRMILFLTIHVATSAWLSPTALRESSKSPLPVLKHRRLVSLGVSTKITDSSSSCGTTTRQPRLSREQIRELKEKKYVIIPNFLPAQFQEQLRLDIQDLRQRGEHFKVARVGQDTTNALNTKIRIAETCFLGRDKSALSGVPNPHREELYSVLDHVRSDLSEHLNQPLDEALTELLYAYYPQGGYYRRHRDAVPGSASTLRKYSLLLYLNEDWDLTRDQGALRMHFDAGRGDELAPGDEPNYLDVAPLGGTLILFDSDSIPHEVLDTQKERMTVIGWFNRPVRMTDVVELNDGSNSTRLILLAVASALVTIGAMGLV